MNERVRDEISAGHWLAAHKNPPSAGARVLGALIVTTAIATLPTVRGTTALAVFACALAAACFSRPNLKRLSLRLGAALGVISALLLPFLLAGDFERLARFGLRALGAATVALSFTSDLSGTELARALGTLRAPKALIEVLEGLASQFDNLKATAQRIMLARKLRGATGFRGTLSIVPELLVRSADRAERLELARRLRGYDPTLRRAGFQRQDLLPILTACVCAALLHAL